MKRQLNKERRCWNADLGMFVSADGRSYWDKEREVFVLLPEHMLRQLEEKKRRRIGKYLHIPINEWLKQAGELPGNVSTLVAIAVIHETNLGGGRSVALSNKLLNVLGVSERSKCRGLEALEKAGLIKVERRSGANPVVTLLLTKSSRSMVPRAPRRKRG
jgi:hypothetical protein